LKSQLCSQRGSDLEELCRVSNWIYSSTTWCEPQREPGYVFLIPPNDLVRANGGMETHLKRWRRLLERELLSVHGWERRN
jgi:hypothetical protein